MLDAKETAKRALLRAEEIKAAKKRRNRLLKTTAITGLCVACAAIILTVTPPIGINKNQVTIDDMPVPLAAPLIPDADAKPYNGTGAENETIKIPNLYNKATIRAGTPEVEIALINPESNPCWFKFEITLADTGETIYISDLVAPSMCIENITLYKTLESGEHPANVTIKQYDLETLEKTGQISVTIALVAQ